MAERGNDILGEFESNSEIRAVISGIRSNHPDVWGLVLGFTGSHPDMVPILPEILKTYQCIVGCFGTGNTLFVCGNGGSFCDSIHISAEFLKSFERKRNLSEADKKRFEGLPYGDEVAGALEKGFSTVVLGLNPALSSAVQNDYRTRYMEFAQHLYAMAHPGDVLIGISTSGNAKNVVFAVTTAKALGLTTIGLTGEGGGELAAAVDIPIKAPIKVTKDVQEKHLPIYHLICAMVEARFFKEKR